MDVTGKTATKSFITSAQASVGTEDQDTYKSASSRARSKSNKRMTKVCKRHTPHSAVGGVGCFMFIAPHYMRTFAQKTRFRKRCKNAHGLPPQHRIVDNISYSLSRIIYKNN